MLYSLSHLLNSSLRLSIFKSLKPKVNPAMDHRPQLTPCLQHNYLLSLPHICQEHTHTDTHTHTHTHTRSSREIASFDFFFFNKDMFSIAPSSPWKGIWLESLPCRWPGSDAKQLEFCIWWPARKKNKALWRGPPAFHAFLVPKFKMCTMLPFNNVQWVMLQNLWSFSDGKNVFLSYWPVLFFF
jgi:hypothetical protein